MEPLKNRDLVEFDGGAGVGKVRGLVIGYTNVSGSSEPGYGFYVVRPLRRLQGQEWDTLVLPGLMLRKLGDLDRLAELVPDDEPTV